MRGQSCLFAMILLAGPAASGFVTLVNDDKGHPHWELLNPVPFQQWIPANLVNPATGAVRYYLGEKGWSVENREAELNALRACFQQWESVPGSHLKFEEAGVLAGEMDVNTADDMNVVFWAPNGRTLVNGEMENIAGVLAITFTAVLVFPSDPDLSLLANADMVLNGRVGWFTDFDDRNNPGQFVEAVALHEFGHFIGLEHSLAGGATMMYINQTGVSTSAGLSADEMAAVRHLYPDPAELSGLATVRGKVTRGGQAIFGAAVVIENASAGVVGGTLTYFDGTYELPRLEPGRYAVRVVPLDPAVAPYKLMRGRDIAPEFGGAITDFLPTTNSDIQLTANQTLTLDFGVAGGNPQFRITDIRPPESDLNPRENTRVNAGIALTRGTQNVIVGVYGPNLPAQGYSDEIPESARAQLEITGDGITLGAPIINPSTFSGTRVLVSVPVSISNDATPGLRSFVLRQGENLAYANGFLEILPDQPDYNFDGLDDRFQRAHFTLFTASEAGPDADPDADGFNNRREQLMGTHPVDALSRFTIKRVELTADRASVYWHSVAGRRYQVFSRRDVAGDPWTPVGNPVTAPGEEAFVHDSNANGEFQFYRVEELSP